MSSTTKPSDPIVSVAGATTALVLFTALNFVNYIDRYILPGVQEQVKREFGTVRRANWSAGLLVHDRVYGDVAADGGLGDRFPRKPMIVVTALLMSACNFFTSSGAFVWVSAAAACGAGCGRGELWNLCSGNAGGFLCGEPAQPGADDLQCCDSDWRGDWSDGGRCDRGALRVAACVCVVGDTWRFNGGVDHSSKEPARAEHAHEKAAVTNVVMSLLRNKAYMYSILGYAAVTFSLGGISNWMASFLQRVTGYSQTEATGVMGPIIVVGGLGGTVVGGWWAQRLLKKNPKAMYYVPGIGAALTVAPAVLCSFGRRA